SLIARKMVQFFKDNGIKSVANLAEDTDHGKGVAKAMVDEARQQGVQTSIQTRFVPAQGRDFTADLVAIKNLNPRPEVLVIDIVNEGNYLAVNQAWETGLAPQTKLFGSFNFPENPSFWQTVG